MHQLLGDRSPVSASGLQASARCDEHGLRPAGREPLEKNGNFTVIRQPVKPKLGSLGLPKRLTQLPPHGPRVGRRYHGADFISP
jgi:hypothetical protein